MMGFGIISIVDFLVLVGVINCLKGIEIDIGSQNLFGVNLCSLDNMNLIYFMVGLVQQNRLLIIYDRICIKIGIVGLEQ